MTRCAIGRALAGAWILAAGAELAQAQAATDDVVLLEEIVVTAQKQPERLAEVPISISVLGGEQLDRAGIETIDDAAKLLGNAYVSVDGPLSPIIYVRGIGTSGDVHGFEQSVGTFVDGVYYGRAQFLAAALLDPDTIELVRGPQGTLLGKNTIGGAFNINTRLPGEETEGDADLRLGNLDQHRYRGRASLPLTDLLALRLAAMDEARGDYLANSSQEPDAGARRSRAWRAKLALRPWGRWSGWLSAQGTRYRGRGDGFQLTAATPESMQLHRQYDPQTEADKTDDHTATDLPGQGNAATSEAATLNVDYALGAGQLTLLSAIARSDLDARLDADQSPAPFIAFDGTEDYRQRSHELRWSGSWRALQGTAGVYVLDTDLGTNVDITSLPQGSAGLIEATLPSPLGELLSAAGDNSADVAPDFLTDASRKRFRQSARARAVFGQLNWDFAPRWRATAGLRYTREHKEVLMRNAFDRSGALFMAFLSEEAYETRRTRVEEDYSPRVALQYAALDDVHLYAAYARGFKGGGFNDLAARADVLEFEEERSGNAETGIKALVLDRSLALNLSLFSTRYRDLQVAAFNGIFFSIQNAASAAIHGAELDTRWFASDGLRFTASLGYLHARYTSFPNAPAQARAGAPPGTGEMTQDLSGQALTFAPRWSGGLGLEYAFPGDWPVRILAGADLRFRDATNLNLDNDPLDRQAAATQLNAFLNLSNADGGLGVSLFGRNLTDERVQLVGGDVFLFAGTHFGTVEPPRTFGAALSFNW